MPTQWRRLPVPAAAEPLAVSGVPGWLAELLARRGVESPERISDFLEPRLEHLEDPRQLAGVIAATERLQAAGERGERVAVVGDYDVDGISATAILLSVLQLCGIEAEPILPHRLEDGYGLQTRHVERARSLGCSLILTADCGSTALAAVSEALAAGLDVIVTDHHLSDLKLPHPVIEVNPQMADAGSSATPLAGAGVAFKVALALAQSSGRELDPLALLRVACLGTICDLVPLRGENRVIAALGLAALAETRSQGLQALIRRSGIRAPFTSADIGFRIGPRLNAVGRMSSPDSALELLLTRDQGKAQQLAEELEDWNRRRQSSEMTVVEEAEQQFANLDPLPNILVAWSDHWHRGVIGIAAGRLARVFHRPTVLLHLEGDSATGSGRSIPEVHLHSFLSRWRDKYKQFGGHAQAVGLTVPRLELEALRRDWEQVAGAEWDPQQLVPCREYELELPTIALNSGLLEQLRRLEPFGVGNRQPVIRVGPMVLDGRPRRFGQQHVAARAVGQDGGVIPLVGWGWQEREAELEGRFDALGCLEEDRFLRSPVLRLLDTRPSRSK